MTTRSLSRIGVAICAVAFCGCALGGTTKSGAWGYTVGDAKVTNCITETQLDSTKTTTPEGIVLESRDLQITKVTENCYTIAGGHMSGTAGGFFSTLLAPLRVVGGLLTGAGGGP